MKRFLLHIFLTLILFSSGCFSSYAQSYSGKYSFDTDINSIRNSTISGFYHEYDEYLQYAPAAVMLGMKIGGYEGRTSWGRMIVSDAFSLAIMAASVEGLKLVVGRERPDGDGFDSFPSGHTATAFVAATFLHKEYGWRSPWFSIGGYTAAAFTGLTRIMNNRHWMSDVVAGAAIGIGSVHLGYYLSDLIFKEKGLNPDYSRPSFHYDPSQKHYVAELMFGRRFIMGGAEQKDADTIPVRGGFAAVSTDIPVKAGLGATTRLSANSMTYRSGTVLPAYSTLAGGYWNLPFARILEFQTHLMAGYSWSASAAGLDVAAGVGLSLITDSNFKFKAFADFEAMNISASRSGLNTFLIGWSSSWFW